MSEISEKLLKNFGQLMQQNHRMMGFMSMNRGGKHFSGQQRVLSVLKKNDGELTTSQLAEELDIRPSSVSELVTKLEKAELVTRTKDENDKRITLVSLTEKGTKLSEERAGKMGGFSEMFFSSLEEEEQVELNRLIEKMLSNTENQRAEWQQRMEQVEHCGHGHGHHHGHRHGGGHHHHGGRSHGRFEGMSDEEKRQAFYKRHPEMHGMDNEEVFFDKFFSKKSDSEETGE